MTVIALASVAVPHVAAQQAERQQAVTPHLDAQAAVGSNQLRMIDPLATGHRRWHGHEIVRHYYARGSSTTTAPGVPRMPDAKEYYASPELARLMETDSAVAALFEGWKRLGIIGTLGLVEPHELRAIAGVPNTQPLLVNVASFGSQQPIGPSALEDNTLLNRVVATFVIVVIWLPAIALIVILARLASAQRQRRARALQLVGLSRTAVRAFHALETSVVAGPAALLGAVLFAVLVNNATQVPGTGLGFYSADVELGWELYAVAVFALTLLVSVVTGMSVRFPTEHGDEVEEGSARPPRRPGLAAWIGWSCLAIGTALLALMPVLIAVVSPSMAAALWLGCALVAAGLALSGPLLVIRLFDAGLRTARSGGRLVGMRLATNHVSTSLRLGSLLSVFIVLLLGSQAFMSILNGGNPQDWDTRLARQPVVPTAVTDLSGGLTLASFDEIAPGAAVAQQHVLRIRHRRVPVLFATCAHVRRLFATPEALCQEDVPAWLSSRATTSQGAAAPAEVNEVEVPGRGRVSVAASAHVIELSNSPDSLDGALRLHPRLAPTQSDGQGSVFYLLADSTRLTQTMARIESVSPTVQFDLGELDRHNPNMQQFPEQIRWLTIGGIMGLLLGVLALIATALGELRERQVRMRTMGLLGSPVRELIGAHLWSTAAPLVVMGWVATACGWLVCLAMRNVDDRAVIYPRAFAAVLIGTLAAAAIVAISTWPGVRRVVSRSRPANA